MSVYRFYNYLTSSKTKQKKQRVIIEKKLLTGRQTESNFIGPSIQGGPIIFYSINDTINDFESMPTAGDFD